MPDTTEPTPLARIEALTADLAAHYSDGDDRELRVAAKLLLVALQQFRRHGGHNWSELVREYVELAERDTEKFARILRANRGGTAAELVDAGDPGARHG